MIKTEMSPYIYTAVLILMRFISYLSKDHFAIDFAVFILCLPKSEKRQIVLFLESHQIKTLNCSFHRNASWVSRVSIKPVHKLSALLNTTFSKISIRSFTFNALPGLCAYFQYRSTARHSSATARSQQAPRVQLQLALQRTSEVKEQYGRGIRALTSLAHT